MGRYASISGRAQHFYGDPSAPEFCTVYASMTIAAYDQKMVDDVPAICVNLGTQLMIFTWVGFAMAVRAFREKEEWLAATCIFLGFNIFNTLCYYESTPLVISTP